jgi:hypothetical protein
MILDLSPKMAGLTALGILGLCLMAPAPGYAQDGCRLIEIIPILIEESGRYCLSPTPRYNADELRSAIVVKADDVTIDLGGRVLAGPRQPDRITEGIYSAGYRNLTVMNGTIEGFMSGIQIAPPLHEPSLGGSYRFTGLTIADSSSRGIAVELGKQRGNVTITDSVIRRTGGSTLVQDASAIGIEISGASGCRIEDSQVLDTMPVGDGDGVAISMSGGNQGCLIQKNRLANSARPEGARTMPVRSADWDPSIVLRENLVSNFAYSSSGLAEDDCRIIDRIPFVIRQNGKYCLPSNPFYHSEDEVRSAILVQADDVTIDLGGHVLAGPRQLDRITEGIYSAGYRSLTVKNGTVEGFMFGIRVAASLQEAAPAGSYRFTGLTIADSSFRGIMVTLGKERGNVTISDNVIARTGGTTFLPDSSAMGIEIFGASNCRVESNQVLDTMPVGVGEAAAISLSGNVQSCLTQKNYLANSARSEWGRTFGFWSTDKHQAIVFRENFVSNFTYAAFDNAVAMYVWNVFDQSDCTPKNASSYYSPAFRKMNQWEREDDTCSDSPRFLAEAARKGDARAQYRMALITSDEAAAERWYKLAAAQGLQVAIERAAQLDSLKKSAKQKSAGTN